MILTIIRPNLAGIMKSRTAKPIEKNTSYMYGLVSMPPSFIFNLGDADAAIRDAVIKFAEEKGYFKYRVYPEEDDVRYFQETRTTRYKKFFILYDKNRLQ